MSYSQSLFTGNGTTTSYAVSFPYIQRSHVLVKVDGVTKTDSTDYIWLSGTTIQFTTAPINGASTAITRNTSPGSRLVQYTSGATLTKDVLETDSKQGYYLAQEALDRQDNALSLNATSTNWDAKSKRIQSISTPTAANDATTKGYVDTAIETKMTAIGAGDVNGPDTSVVGRLAAWGNATGTILNDSGVAVANILQADTTVSVTGNLPKYSDTGGIQIADSGIPTGDVVRATASATATGQVVVAERLQSP